MTISSRIPRRRALLVGVKATRNFPNLPPVSGAHRDTEYVRRLLIEVYKYRPEDIMILIDDPAFDRNEREWRWPTKRNIVRAMYKLVEGAAPGDTVVFHFSGHGGQIEALEDPDEVDNLDEILFPMDVMRAPQGEDIRIPYVNYVKDDLIRRIFERLPAGSRGVLIFDCCNSGTAADLPDVTGRGPLLAVLPRGASGSDMTQIPELTSFAACKDGQNTSGNSKGGIFVRAFCNALRRDPYPTHRKLMQNITEEIEELLRSVPAEKKASVIRPVPQLGSLRGDAIWSTKFAL
ncbi:peptidase C14 [Trametes cingulata]|nr:peptidase C14 [Trametes cingulata]